MHSLVIARYSENVDWLVQVPDNYEIFLYNKGEPIQSPELLKRVNHIIDRPNMGRESETYLHHMMTVKRMDHDFTVFAQGDPFEHSPDFLPLLDTWVEWDKVQALSWQWMAERNIPPASLLDDYMPLLKGGLRVRPERYSLITWGPLDFTDAGASGMSMVYRLLHGNPPEGINVAGHYLRSCGLDELADKAEAHTVGVFSYGAIFAVRNDLIARFPQHGLDAMRNLANTGVTVYGYVLERLWLHLFGQEFLVPKQR
ncbi:hypothetical protein [Rhizobium oryzicola]|uniref:Uncharacterized protein n=1 Tax=Rhizobium oryzicola TaxID=1232668 RepID=A0ABT8SVN7_9HYPH|nr:hypothetical protein [Rhizobium oryzicola]MDO1582214.1 hypothetical protein [Rhizobium oryzicola]